MPPTLDDVRRLIARQLGRRAVGPEERLVEDLGAESIDVLNVVAALEDRYEVEIPEQELPDLATAAALHRRVCELRGEARGE